MAVPDYESLMYPVLRELSDGRERQVGDVRRAVATELKLTAEDLAELLPSGKTGKFANRVSWAHGYLKEAGLLRSVRWGIYQITDRGRAALTDCGGRLDNEFLTRFSEFNEFRTRSSKPSPTAAGSLAPQSKIQQPTTTTANDLTPDELVREGYQRARARVATDLLDRVKQASPIFFEELVVELLVAMGYGGTYADAASVVGRSGDGGIDGIIKEDRLGLESIYIQAKRWNSSSVGRPDIQQFAGALQGQKARKGVFITTSTFTREARDYAELVQATIVLIDGQQLAELMLDYGVGVSVQDTIKLFKVDEDYFVED